MAPRRSSRLFAACAALLSWFALLLQLYLSIRLSIANGGGVTHGVWMYFAFFTILTNILVAGVLTLPLIAPESRAGRFSARPSTIAGVAANIAVVAVTYNLLLRNVWNPQGLQLLADILLHDAMPIVFVVHAWLRADQLRASFGDRTLWILWPIAYFAYAIARGAATGFYPYPFIDAGHLGYQQVFVNSAGLCIGYLLVATVLFALDRLRSRTRS